MNRSGKVLGSASLLLLAAMSVAAQTNSQSPKPPTEAQKLAVYIGKWTVEADVPASGKAAAAKAHGTIDCDWVAQESGVLCRENIFVPGRSGLVDAYLVAYDEHAKNYFFMQISAGGYLWKGSGTLDGDTWTWTVNDTDRDGKPYQARFTEKISSPGIIQFKNEFSESGAAIHVMMQGTETRIQASAPAAQKQ